MPEDSLQVSVIIVSYNTKELTKKAIQAVIDKTEGIEYEIIVIDNDSKDGSAEELKKTFQDKITLIESKENLGFGRANNLGIKQAKGKYIFLLNPDTELINNAIKIFYDYMEQNVQVGVCGGNLYNIKDVPEQSFMMYRNSTGSFLFWRYLELFYNIISKFNKKKKYCRFNYSNKVKEVGYISGADMFIRKQSLEKSGLFDETFFMYGEDVDLNFRIRNCGYLISSLPQAKIYHYVSQSSKNSVASFDINFYGTYYLFFKYFGKKTFFIYLDIKLTLLRKACFSFFVDKEKTKIYFDILKKNKERYLEQKNRYNKQNGF